MLAAAWSALGLAAAVLAHRWRQRLLRLCLVVVLTAVAAIVALMATGDVVPVLVSQAARLLIGTVLLSVVAVLLTVRALPRLSSRRDRGSAAAICGVVTVGYLAVAVFLTMAADDQMRVGELPQLRTRDEFIALRDGSAPPGGALMEATLSDRNPTFDDGAVASIACPSVGPVRIPGTSHRLPERYLLDFPGGPPVVAAGPKSSLQTWGWPPDGSGDCVLRHSAAVVFWGDVRKGMGIDASTSHTGLADTRMIAVGDIASFIREYTPVAHRTAGAVYALACLNAGLGLLMIAVGAVTWRRLTRTGNAAPPRITWRAG
jgi:hypothetical protein